MYASQLFSGYICKVTRIHSALLTHKQTERFNDFIIQIINSKISCTSFWAYVGPGQYARRIHRLTFLIDGSYNLGATSTNHTKTQINLYFNVFAASRPREGRHCDPALSTLKTIKILYFMFIMPGKEGSGTLVHKVDTKSFQNPAIHYLVSINNLRKLLNPHALL